METQNNKSLFDIISMGSIEDFEEYIKEGFDFEKHGETALKYTSEHNRTEMFIYLLSKGARTKIFEESILKQAIKDKNLKIIQGLVKYGSKPSKWNDGVYELIGSSGAINILDFLLENHFKIKSKEVIKGAIQYPKMEVFEILDKYNVKMSGIIEVVFTASCLYGSMKIIEYCIEKKGLNPNISKGACLKNVCSTGKLEALKYLVAKGGKFNKIEEICIQKAAIANNIDILKYLIEEKGLNSYELYDETLKCCLDSKNYAAAKYLIEYKNDLDFMNEFMSKYHVNEALFCSIHEKMIMNSSLNDVKSKRKIKL